MHTRGKKERMFQSNFKLKRNLESQELREKEEKKYFPMFRVLYYVYFLLNIFPTMHASTYNSIQIKGGLTFKIFKTDGTKWLEMSFLVDWPLNFIALFLFVLLNPFT